MLPAESITLPVVVTEGYGKTIDAFARQVATGEEGDLKLEFLSLALGGMKVIVKRGDEVLRTVKVDSMELMQTLGQVAVVGLDKTDEEDA